MQLAKSTFTRNITTAKTFCTVLFLLSVQNLLAQENSPYSRYGLGDLVPNTNIVSRGMGGLSAAYTDRFSVNYNNPASFSKFLTRIDKAGYPVLDVGVNYDSRTLQAPNQPVSFSSSYGYFSHVQVGIPLTPKWGMAFGLRPISRINYKIDRNEKLTDPVTGKIIDTAVTQFSGNGGAFLPTIGTGYSFGNLSVGGNIGYLFGRKEVSTKRAFLNDSVSYQSSNYSNLTNFGGVFFNAGLQYNIILSKDKKTSLRLGASGNWEQTIKANRDLVRETFVTDINGATQRVDSVFSTAEESGKMIYPAAYTFGFVLEHAAESGQGWLLGVDYVMSKMSDFRLFNEGDAVKDGSQIRVGAQMRPKPSANYFNNVAYRAGFFVGTDYIYVGKELPQYGFTFGLGLPLANYSPVSRNQFTIINLGFEYSKRGKNDNLLKENLFRVSVGLNLSDLWFIKRRYD